MDSCSGPPADPSAAPSASTALSALEETHTTFLDEFLRDAEISTLRFRDVIGAVTSTFGPITIQCESAVMSYARAHLSRPSADIAPSTSSCPSIPTSVYLTGFDTERKATLINIIRAALRDGYQETAALLDQSSGAPVLLMSCPSDTEAERFADRLRKEGATVVLDASPDPTHFTCDDDSLSASSDENIHRLLEVETPFEFISFD